MTKTAQELYKFLSSFGCAVYDAQSVPDDAQMPYITYSAASFDWDAAGMISATIWCNGTSYAPVYAIVDMIEDDIGEGKTLKTADGYIVLSKGTPWCQTQDTGVANVKAAYLNIDIMTITK